MEDQLTKYLGLITVQQYKSDIGFRTLVESVDENMYIIPKYQRKYRWNREQLAGLVESLLRGLPIPPIYTCRNQDNQLEILDGQQRVLSLFFYYIGCFLDKPKNNFVDFSELETGNAPFSDVLKAHYQMKDLHVSLKGEGGELINVDYASLPVNVKRRVDYTSITVVELKIDEGGKEDILRNIFSNLNTGGSPLTKQEQRNGIYVCDFYEMLRNFNKKNENWRKLWGRESSKEEDTEALLRFCALKKYASVKENRNKGLEFKIEGYYESYGKMLDRFSKESMAFSQEEIQNYKMSLEEFVKLFEVTTVLPRKVSLMEGFYIIYEKLGVKNSITRQVLDQVQSASGYKENSAQRPVHIKKMNGRWNAIYEIWRGIP